MNNYFLPTYFDIEEERFQIREKGDFRIVLSCFNILYNVELSEKERLFTCLLLFYEDFENDLDRLLGCRHLEELVRKMYWFFDCGQDYTNNKQKHQLVDWDKDSLLISSAVNKVAGKDVRSEEYCHWWTFISYYMAIGECALSQVVSIRSKIIKGKKLEKYEKEFKNENPQYFNIDYRTQEEKAVDDWIQELWNGGEQ